VNNMRARLATGGLDFVLSVCVAILALLVALIFVVAAGVSFTSGADAFVSGAFGSSTSPARWPRWCR